jgi:hypothetical protein
VSDKLTRYGHYDEGPGAMLEDECGNWYAKDEVDTRIAELERQLATALNARAEPVAEVAGAIRVARAGLDTLNTASLGSEARLFAPEPPPRRRLSLWFLRTGIALAAEAPAFHASVGLMATTSAAMATRTLAVNLSMPPLRRRPLCRVLTHWCVRRPRKTWPTCKTR